jgi:hypothetical protein
MESLLRYLKELDHRIFHPLHFVLRLAHGSVSFLIPSSLTFFLSQDGQHLSNTFTLLTENNWSGLLCEADPIRSEQSLQFYSHRSDIKSINTLVEVTGNNSLISILEKEQVNSNFEFLSIDIDGNDYHLWKSFINSSYQPKVVCIEFNPTIPNHILFIQENLMNKQQGSSLLAFKELGELLGYQLICTTTFNAFFVRNDFMKYILLNGEGGGGEGQEYDFSLSALHPSPSSMMTDLFQTYDGELKLCGPKKLIWHKVAINIQSIQPLKKKKSRVFPFAPRTSVSDSGSMSTSDGTLIPTHYSLLMKLESSLEVLIDSHQLINSHSEKKKKKISTDREDFETWCTASFLQLMVESCDQVINITQVITDGVPFEISSPSSPYYEIAVDAMLWCILIICHASHNLLDGWFHPSSLISSSTFLQLPQTVIHFLTSSLQSIHAISALYQSIYSASQGPQNLFLTSQAYQHSMYFYCLFDCCLAPYQTLSTEIGLIRQGVSNSISDLASRMNSKIKINKNDRNLFNFSDRSNDEISSSGAGFINSNKIWQALFEKSYWIWLQQIAAGHHTEPLQTHHGGLEFHNLITNNLRDQLMNRIGDLKLKRQEKSAAGPEGVGLRAEATKPMKMPDGNEDFETEEVFDLISKVCGRLNLKKKYQESSNQRNEVIRLEQQLTQYRRLSLLLFGVSVVSLGCSIMSCKWKRL